VDKFLDVLSFENSFTKIGTESSILHAIMLRLTLKIINVDRLILIITFLRPLSPYYLSNPLLWTYYP